MSTPVSLPILTINRFSDDKLQAAIDKALADLPADKSGSLVAHADLTGVTLTVVERLGSVWSIKAGAIKPWNQPLSAEVDVVAAW